jgi:hypothetical protein
MQAVATLLLLLAGSGCFANPWHQESYLDQRAYVHNDSAALRRDLSDAISFLPSMGLKRLNADDSPSTEAVFVRDMSDHFHETVTVRGLADVTSANWVMTVRVVSYNVGEEGAITAGQALLKEIDGWHAAASRGHVLPVVPNLPAATTQPRD